MERSEPEHALALYCRAPPGPPIATSPPPATTASGNALYRLDREAEAREAWEQATGFGETPVTYRAWRQVAAARVREGDLAGRARGLPPVREARAPARTGRRSPRAWAG